MAKIKILDTGYVSSTGTTSQTQLSDANRAGYTGAAVTSFTLNNEGLSLSGGNTIERKNPVDTFDNTTTSSVGVKNRSVRVTTRWHKTETTSGYQYNEIFQFMRMERTKGLKLLYLTDVNEIDGYVNLVQIMGRENVGGEFSDASPSDDSGKIGQTIPYLVGRVQNMTLSDPTNTTYYTIAFDFVLNKSD